MSTAMIAKAEVEAKSGNTPKPMEWNPVSSCVHCGFCLEACPTYRLSGDENNSPRGRLRLWREETAGRLAQDPWTDFYTDECVGCLACEPVCPANVPYGELLEQTRRNQVKTHRRVPKPSIRTAAALVKYSSGFDAALLPARALRAGGMLRHRQIFPGKPALFQSTAAYARTLMERHRPTGPRVALLTGCLMEGLFREINFATVRVLIANNIQVAVPEGQGCCGAFLEHAGMEGIEALRERNRQAFLSGDFDCVVSNAAGCGLSLQKTLGRERPVVDVLWFLAEYGIKPRPKRKDAARVYLDLPCHLVHGQRRDGIPPAILDATGYDWELAPQAKNCCGSGGIYHIEKPENARTILKEKAAFLNSAEGDPVILATANHVCMMQWHSASKTGLVKRPFQVRHVIQLLDGYDAAPPPCPANLSHTTHQTP